MYYIVYCYQLYPIISPQNGLLLKNCKSPENQTMEAPAQQCCSGLLVGYFQYKSKPATTIFHNITRHKHFHKFSIFIQTVFFSTCPVVFFIETLIIANIIITLHINSPYMQIHHLNQFTIKSLQAIGLLLKSTANIIVPSFPFPKKPMGFSHYHRTTSCSGAIFFRHWHWPPGDPGDRDADEDATWTNFRHPAR